MLPQREDIEVNRLKPHLKNPASAAGRNAFISQGPDRCDFVYKQSDH